jgi:hypothetical protein
VWLEHFKGLVPIEYCSLKFHLQAINNEIEPAEEAITGVDHYDNSSMVGDITLSSNNNSADLQIDEMKYLLTEVLLDVTSEEINTISTETIDEFKGISLLLHFSIEVCID